MLMIEKNQQSHWTIRVTGLFLVLLCSLALLFNFNDGIGLLPSFKLTHDYYCEGYTSYSTKRHAPFSEGPLRLPFQRPPQHCRKFTSTAVEQFIDNLRKKMKDPDLFRLVENTLPNTLDTAILWYDDDLDAPRTFVSTGDIHAEWLRDSARQLSVYQQFIDKDPKLKHLIKGAILQQAKFITVAPYCNAFHSPVGSGIEKRPSNIDEVHPKPDWDQVFECKWELDSLASFLTLSNEYFENSQDFDLLKDDLWLEALKTVLVVLNKQMQPTFSKNGRLLPAMYTFKRQTKLGTETLSLDGRGNPVNSDTGLIRSAFRPSDDATIFQLFIPANAQMFVELAKITPLLETYNENIDLFGKKLCEFTKELSASIKLGIEKHGVVNHPIFGKVYAYEVDGYGSFNIMDDANIPSLLSLPDLGYGSVHDEVYQNTRKMVLSKNGNPYYLSGEYFKGIGGPHVGLSKAWPMSLLVQIRTSDNDQEIMELLKLLKSNTAGLGLMHEGINVDILGGHDYSRSWFSWCNSEFGKTVLDLLKRKPHLLT